MLCVVCFLQHCYDIGDGEWFNLRLQISENKMADIQKSAKRRDIWDVYGMYMGDIWEIYGRYAIYMVDFSDNYTPIKQEYTSKRLTISILTIT